LAARAAVRYNDANQEKLGVLGDRMSNSLVNRLLCVALVVAVIFPLGRFVFPMIGHDIGETPFGALEAVVSTTLGFGLYAILFT
jgi:hypothetical protein